MASTQARVREDIDLEAVKAHGGFSVGNSRDFDEPESSGPIKRCPECRRKISVSPRREGVEYGHSNGGDGGERCSRRPDCVDPCEREEWPTYYGENPDLLTDDSQEGEA